MGEIYGRERGKSWMWVRYVERREGGWWGGGFKYLRMSYLSITVH